MAAAPRLHWVAFTAGEVADLARGVLTEPVRERIRLSVAAPLAEFLERRTADPKTAKAMADQARTHRVERRIYGRRRSS